MPRTAEQMSFLRALDCEEIQGYYFSKPQPAGAIADLIRQHAPTTTPSRPASPIASNDPHAGPIRKSSRR